MFHESFLRDILKEKKTKRLLEKFWQRMKNEKEKAVLEIRGKRNMKLVDYFILALSRSEVCVLVIMITLRTQKECGKRT